MAMTFTMAATMTLAMAATMTLAMAATMTLAIAATMTAVPVTMAATMNGHATGSHIDMLR